MAAEVDLRQLSTGIPDGDTSKILNQHFDLLSEIDEQAAGMVGAFSTAYGYRVAEVAKILKEIEDLYIETYRRHGKIGAKNFYKKRQVLFRRLDEALGKLVRSRALNSKSPRVKQALGLSTKSITNTWKKQGHASEIPKFKAHYERTARVARNLKWLGYAGIALDGFYSYRQVREACTEGKRQPLLHEKEIY